MDCTVSKSKGKEICVLVILLDQDVGTFSSIHPHTHTLKNTNIRQKKLGMFGIRILDRKLRIQIKKFGIKFWKKCQQQLNVREEFQP